MSELKPCPFCGIECELEEVQFAFSTDKFVTHPLHYCLLSGMKFTFNRWQRRFYEDALNQRIAYLESLLRWRPVSEIPTKGGFYEVKYWKFGRKYIDVVSWNPHTIGFYNLDADSVIEWRPIPELEVKDAIQNT